MKVLIVDDEPLVRRAIRRAAESRGHAIVEASNGNEGLQMWEDDLFDLVFLDVLMPGLSGPEVLHEKTKPHTSRVVLMSAYSGDYNLEKAKSIGADIFIPKPFDDIFKLIEIAEELVNVRA